MRTFPKSDQDEREIDGDNVNTECHVYGGTYSTSPGSTSTTKGVPGDVVSCSSNANIEMLQLHDASKMVETGQCKRTADVQSWGHGMCPSMTCVRESAQ